MKIKEISPTLKSRQVPPLPLASNPGGAECISFAGNAPLPPNLRPVIVLKGSDYDMGYQFYQQSVEVWGPWVASHQWVGKIWGFVPIHQEEYTQEQIKALEAFQWYIKQDAPEWIDFMKGMAAGANDSGIPVSYNDVLALFARRNETEGGVPLYPGTEPEGSQEEELPSNEHCSGFAAWGNATKDGRVIASGSADHILKFKITLVVYPDTGNIYIYATYNTMCLAGAGLPGMNYKGL